MSEEHIETLDQKGRMKAVIEGVQAALKDSDDVAAFALCIVSGDGGSISTFGMPTADHYEHQHGGCLLLGIKDLEVHIYNCWRRLQAEIAYKREAEAAGGEVDETAN